MAWVWLSSKVLGHASHFLLRGKLASLFLFCGNRESSLVCDAIFRGEEAAHFGGGVRGAQRLDACEVCLYLVQSVLGTGYPSLKCLHVLYESDGRQWSVGTVIFHAKDACQ